MSGIGVSVLTLALSLPVNPNLWERVDEANGVLIWTRAVPGSDYLEIKAEAVIPAPAAKIWRVLADVESFIEFMPYTHRMQILQTLSDGYVNYVVTDPPWISRRDFASQHTLVVNEAAGLYQRYFKEANDLAPPPKKGVVRMERIRGYWSVEALDEKHAIVQYVVHTDPGGLVPSWLVNRGSPETMTEVFRCLRNRLRDPDWKRG